MAALEAWVPGAVAPSVKVQAHHPLRQPRRRRERHRHRSASRAQGLGAGQADARGHADLALSRHQRHHPRRPPGGEDRRPDRRQHHACRPAEGARINAQVVGFFHTGVRQIDEGTAYVLIKTGQILAQQTGLSTNCACALADPMAARDDRRAHRARNRLQVGVLAGGQRGPASRPSSSATSSCTRWSAPSCWWRASAPTTSSPPSPTRRRATSPS